MSQDKPAAFKSIIWKNVAANFTGRVWVSVLSIAFLPIYIRILGIEAYGLIGVYTSLVALLAFLDLGLSTTLSRELARISTSLEAHEYPRDLVRTLELVYWTIGALAGLAIIVLAPTISAKWLNNSQVSEATVRKAVIIMGFLIAIEWPTALYTGGLLGLERQIKINILRAGTATFQNIGAIFILWYVSPTINAYFACQLAASTSLTLLLGFSLWRALPTQDGRKQSFRYELLKKNWRFTAGMFGIAVMTSVLTQLDKVILSKWLTLESFGYYILAWNMANLLTHIGAPVFHALFPRFSQLVALGNVQELSDTYHKWSRLLSMVLLPVSAAVALFPREILSIWFGDPAVAQNTAILLSLLITGMCINSVMVLPYTLQLAYGWTRLSFMKNLIAVLLIVPSLFVMIRGYGPTGAAWVWVALNVGYLVFEIPLMHKKILRHEMQQWYMHDVGIPLLFTIGIFSLSRITMPSDTTGIFVLFWITATTLAAMVLSMMQFPETREWIRRQFIK